MTAKIAHIVFDSLSISAATEWHFLRIADSDGHIGHGEATLGSQAQALADYARATLPTLLRKPATSLGLETLLPAQDLPQAALRSAVDMALREIEAKRAGQTLAAQLAPQSADDVRFYANINRRSRARTPKAFADSARLAMDRGFDIVKIAPFDEVTPERCDAQNLEALIAPARTRIEAVIGAIEDRAKLRIDCHWRFTASAARAMIDAMGEYRPDWIECPIAEMPQAAPAIADLRRFSARRDIRLAGLETGIAAASFEPYLAAGSYDVIMPDVKYIGGLDELNRLADMASRTGTVLSLHNPTGPVAHAVSAHAAAAFAPTAVHELQFDETPYFSALVEDCRAIPTSARAKIDKDLVGTGLGFERTVLDRLCRRDRSFAI